jgi:hypothetical protein
MRIIRFFSALVVAAAMLSACSTSTKLTGTWKADPAASYHFKNIAIIGIANNSDVRKTVEDALEMDLDAKGFNTTGALMFLPPNATKENISREIVIDFINANKFDAVITIGLVKKEENSEYIPGQYYYTPYYNAPFYDYYGIYGGYSYSPGYYVESTSYLLQTNLYSFPDGKILWSAQTTTVPLNEISQTAAALALTLTDALVKSNVMTP